MKFAKWIKPGTNEVRIYINDANVDGRPFIASLNGEGACDLWTVKCFGLSTSQIDVLIARVEQQFDATFGECPAKFGEVLTLIA